MDLTVAACPLGMRVLSGGAAIHGAVILELAGKLPPGGARDLFPAFDTILMRGFSPPA